MASGRSRLFTHIQEVSRIWVVVNGPGAVAFTIAVDDYRLHDGFGPAVQTIVTRIDLYYEAEDTKNDTAILQYTSHLNWDESSNADHSLLCTEYGERET